MLEPQQDELLSILVEAYRNVPKEKREPFLALRLYAGPNLTVSHKGLTGGQCSVYSTDLEVLEREQLITVSEISRGSAFQVDILPLGFSYYTEWKQRDQLAFGTIEATIRTFLDSNRFSTKYPAAYQKLKEAESLLWVSDSTRQLTTIGHICREALQEFATALVEQHQPPNVDNDKARTVSRIKSVIKVHDERLGASVRAHLKALITYWGTVSDLIQRQEHGGQKEGEPLIWEDGRRAVFQSAIVMYEIDTSLSTLY